MASKITDNITKIKNFYAKRVDYARNNPRAVQIAVVAVILVGAFSYGALEFTSQPGFCKNCHEMHPAWNNWASSVHSEVDCYACHMPPGIVNLLKHKVASAKELYLHVTVFSKPNPPTIYAKDLEPVNGACETCHSPKRILSFSGDLKVPHQLHLDQGLTCPTCHSRVVHGDPDQRKPKMEICLTCHDGKKKNKEGKLIKSDCVTCHKKKNVPPTHKNANWRQVHGQEAAKSYLNCKKCHDWRPDWCMQCHKKPPTSHKVLWRSNHGAQAKADRISCNACHKSTFCMKCHGIQP